LAAALFIVASSPYEFFWSQSAWDLFTNFGPFLILSLLAASPFGPGRGALLGALCGLAISAHPMVTPFALAVLASLSLSRADTLQRKTLTLTVTGIAGVVTATVARLTSGAQQRRSARRAHASNDQFTPGRSCGTQLLSDTHGRDCCATAT
jgi:hypothetical protein